jgi:hypothetical protein
MHIDCQIILIKHRVVKIFNHNPGFSWTLQFAACKEFYFEQLPQDDDQHRVPETQGRCLCHDHLLHSARSRMNERDE